MASGDQQRGMQLVELGRFKEALPFLNKAMHQREDLHLTKYLIALCSLNLDDIKKAEAMALDCLSEEPNDPDTLNLMANIALQKGQHKEAIEYIDQAIEIYPFSASYYALKAAIFLNKKQYKTGLKWVNIGLENDPKNRFCLNIRAQLLTKLKRNEDAEETIQNLLEDNPEDSYSHANVGWVALEKGKHKEAVNHFKEALVLNPNDGYAREGMVAAIKSKNWFYRNYLKYAFWISRQSNTNQWVFIIGIYLAYRFAFKSLSGAGMIYLATPLLIAYLLFALGGWIMEPMSNCILQFDQHGRYLLDKDQRQSGLSFGLLLVSAALFFGIFIGFDSTAFLTLSVACLGAILPIPRAFLLDEKNNRTFGFIYGGAMLAVGLFGAVVDGGQGYYIPALLLMMVGYTWLGNLFNK